MPSTTTPLTTVSQLPMAVPTAVATTVAKPSKPFADEILFERSISGMLPNFAGPNKCSLTADESDDDKHRILVADHHRSQHHEGDFGDLAPNDHARLL